MEIFELWTHVLEEIKIKNPEYYNNFYSFVFPISFSDGIFTAMTTVPYMIPWINAVYKTKLEKILSEKSGMPVKLVLQSQENSEVPAADPVPETSAVSELPEILEFLLFLLYPIRRKRKIPIYLSLLIRQKKTRKSMRNL